MAYSFESEKNTLQFELFVVHPTKRNISQNIAMLEKICIFALSFER